MSDFTYKMNMVIIQLVHAFKELATPIKNEFTRDYPKLECKTYGFDCDFISIGIPEKVIKDFVYDAVIDPRPCIAENKRVFIRADEGSDFNLTIGIGIKIVNRIANQIENDKVEQRLVDFGDKVVLSRKFHPFDDVFVFKTVSTHRKIHRFMNRGKRKGFMHSRSIADFAQDDVDELASTLNCCLAFFDIASDLVIGCIAINVLFQRFKLKLNLRQWVAHFMGDRVG